MLKTGALQYIMTAAKHYRILKIWVCY